MISWYEAYRREQTRNTELLEKILDMRRELEGLEAIEKLNREQAGMIRTMNETISELRSQVEKSEESEILLKRRLLELASKVPVPTPKRASMSSIVSPGPNIDYSVLRHELVRESIKHDNTKAELEHALEEVETLRQEKEDERKEFEELRAKHTKMGTMVEDAITTLDTAIFS